MDSFVPDESHSPDDTNVHGSIGGELEGIGSVKGLKVVKSCSCGGTSKLLVKTLLLWDASFSHNTLRHRQTDRQTDRVADGSMMTIADRTA